MITNKEKEEQVEKEERKKRILIQKKHKKPTHTKTTKGEEVRKKKIK